MIASREAPGGAVRVDEPEYRHLMGRVNNFIIKAAAINDFEDTQCGFKMFRRAVAEDLFAVQRMNGIGFDVELLFIAKRRRYKVKEVPITWYFDPYSTMRHLDDSVKMLREIWQIRQNWAPGSLMAERKSKLKTASLQHERQYYRAGYRLIVGMDEAGRGPLAGPVAAAAVGPAPGAPRPRPKPLRGVRDSKEMTAPQREALGQVIKDIATVWGIGQASAREIDDIGIAAATKTAMGRALDQALAATALQPDCLFLDYMPWPERSDIPQLSIVDGDKRSLSIACASVLAKVWRDQFYAAGWTSDTPTTASRGTKAMARRRICGRSKIMDLAPPIAIPSSPSASEASPACVIIKACQTGEPLEDRAGSRLAESNWRRGRRSEVAHAALSRQPGVRQPFRQVADARRLSRLRHSRALARPPARDLPAPSSLLAAISNRLASAQIGRL